MSAVWSAVPTSHPPLEGEGRREATGWGGSLDAGRRALPPHAGVSHPTPTPPPQGEGTPSDPRSSSPLAAGNDDDPPLLVARGLTKRYGDRVGCQGVSLEVHPGEVLAVVGESGSGKSTLLSLLAAKMTPSAGRVLYRPAGGALTDLASLSEAERRRLARTEWGFVHQDPAQGLRMAVSAGANVGERLMAVGERHYGRLRGAATDWLARVEIAGDRVDDAPRQFSGGMRQRLQIARNLVTHPRLVLMDEPTGGLDVSVQARLLDLLRRLVADLGLAAVVVTHDLGVARLLSHRIVVMRGGAVIETGLTDQVLDDPAEPYTQLLVASIPEAR